MARYASYRISKLSDAHLTLIPYYVQLALNFSWTPLFFGMKLMAPAAGVIVATLGTVAYTGVKFWERDRVSGALMLPYVAWLALASTVNVSTWWMNRDKTIQPKKD